MKTQQQNVLENRLTTTRRNKRSKKSTKGRENSEPIPTDLVLEVLSRLPAKSIARFRCVSKPWGSILLRPDFTELFLTRSSTKPKLLFACKKNGELLFFSSPQPQNPDENSSLIAVSHHMKFSFDVDSISEVLRPVQGLICLQNLRILKGRKDTVLEICNPSTGQSLTLPKVKTRRIGVTSFLGYDPIDKQFKLLYMTRLRYGENRFSEEHQILTLGTGKLSWRMIECRINHYPISYGICINGVLYYRAMTDEFKEDYGIVCFDIRSEKFKIFEDLKVRYGKLVDYKGKLASLKFDNNVLSIIFGRSRSFELFVLEDGEKNEWSKHTYVLPILWKDIVADDWLSIVGITRTGEIVLYSYYPPARFYFIYYNLERNTIVKVEIQGLEACISERVHTFLEHVEDVKLGGVFGTS